MVHAQAGSEFWLIDLGSSNGTYLNSRRVTQPCRLNDGDRIEIGGFAFTFRHPTLAGAEKADGGTEKTIQDIRTRTCWLLVADIESSTQFSQAMPGEEGMRVTGRWLAACKQIVDEQHGSINKFLGDGFLAYWNDTEEAAKAVATTISQLRKMQDQGHLRFRIVLHFGPVFVGGVASMGEESLLGNEVNFVFRMEKLAGRLGVTRLLSEPAKEKLAAILETAHECKETLQGFTGEFDFYSF